jgi:predicted phage tail component-like protein
MSIITRFGTLTDVSFGDDDLSDLAFYTYNFVKPLMPRQSQNTIDIPNRSGLIQASKKFVDNTIKVYGFLDCSSNSDLITKIGALSAALYSDDDKELIWDAQDDRYYNAQYMDAVEVNRELDYAVILLNFICNDPFAYAVTADDDDELGITTLDYTYTITNGGHYYALPVITITFNQAQSHIYVKNNNIAGNRLDVSKTFETNDELEIDCLNRKMYLNDVEDPFGFGDGGESLAEFIKLATGINEIQVGSENATIDVDININFRKTYLY